MTGNDKLGKMLKRKMKGNLKKSETTIGARQIGQSLGIALLVVACTPTISKTEYDRRCRETYKPNNTLTGQVYYQGSKDGYDYFLFEPFGSMSDRARVREGDVELKKRIAYNKDRDKWIVAYPDWSGTTNLMIEPRKTN